MDLKFTAHMEDELDDIATAKEDMVKVLDEFYHPFQESLKLAADEHGAGAGARRRRPATSAARRWSMKYSKSGRFLGCSKYPECKATRPIDGQPRAGGGRDRASLHQVRQAADAPREQARASCCPARAIPPARSRSTSTPRAIPSPRSSRPSTSARSAASRWSCARGRGATSSAARATPSAATPCPSTTRDSPSRRSRSRSSARSAAARWGSSKGAAARSSAA